MSTKARPPLARAGLGSHVGADVAGGSCFDSVECRRLTMAAHPTGLVVFYRVVFGFVCFQGRLFVFPVFSVL